MVSDTIDHARYSVYPESPVYDRKKLQKQNPKPVAVRPRPRMFDVLDGLDEVSSEPERVRWEFSRRENGPAQEDSF